MKSLKIAGIASAFGLALVLAPFQTSTSAQAMPNGLMQTQIVPDNSATLQKVVRRGRWERRHSRDWRRRHWRRHGHRYDDWSPGAYIALGLFGALLNHGLSEGQARTAMQRCDDRFRSFEWDTGLYTTYGGDKRLCPYLR